MGISLNGWGSFGTALRMKDFGTRPIAVGEVLRHSQLIFMGYMLHHKFASFNTEDKRIWTE